MSVRANVRRRVRIIGSRSKSRVRIRVRVGARVGARKRVGARVRNPSPCPLHYSMH